MSRLPSTIDQAYAFAHGRIGVLQQLLLGRGDIDRLLGSHTLREAESILTELKLTAQAGQSMSHEEEILDTVALWMRSEVERMSPADKHDVFTILWMEDDAPLLSYLLKRKFGLTSVISQQPKDLLASLDAATVWNALETGDTSALPDKLAAFVELMLKEASPSPSMIDTKVSQFIAKQQLAVAKKSGSAGIVRFAKHGIDVRNLRTALRLQNKPAGERLQELLEGGSVPPKSLIGSTTDIARAAEEAGLGYGLAKQLRAKDIDWNTVERALSDVLAADIAILWNVPLSVEPLFAFAALTLSQLRLLRVLMIGKRSGLSPQEIKKILPPFIPATHYVL